MPESPPTRVSLALNPGYDAPASETVAPDFAFVQPKLRQMRERGGG